MVYCVKCGTKNADDAIECTKCGAVLQASRSERRRRSEDACFGSSERRDVESECFGLPHGGAIVGIIFGVLVVIIGLAILSGVTIWNYFGPIIMVIIGTLIVIGALYGLRRR
jgi:uncharacterized membrane protein YvbJ